MGDHITTIPLQIQSNIEKVGIYLCLLLDSISQCQFPNYFKLLLRVSAVKVCCRCKNPTRLRAV